MPANSLHFESTVMAEVAVPNGGSVGLWFRWLISVLTAAKWFPMLFFCPFFFLFQLYTVTEVLWDLHIRHRGGTSPSSRSQLCTFLRSPSLCQPRLPLQAQSEPLVPVQLLSTTSSKIPGGALPFTLVMSLNAPFVCFFQAHTLVKKWGLFYHTCGTSCAPVLSCNLPLQRVLSCMPSASSLSFGVIYLTFASHSRGLPNLCTAGLLDFWLVQSFLNQKPLP